MEGYMVFMASTTLIVAIGTILYPEKDVPQHKDLKFKEVVVLVNIE